ncbi:hypothetical protein JW964_14270 [candidate division KSB1 bacterium]|nr:hypothetical protein [candidate division KSB1 bacterium]
MTIKNLCLLLLMLTIIPITGTGGITGVFSTDTTKARMVKEFSIASLDSLLLEKSKSSQIIMLSDFYHRHGFYMSNVTAFLNYWLERLTAKSKDKNLPTKMVLVLEVYQEMQVEINSFLNTGDISKLLTYYIELHAKSFSNIFTVDYLVFLNELRQIKLRIDAIRNNNKQIEFKIICAESDPPYKFQDVINMSREEFERQRLLWFVYDRDRLSAENVSRFLQENPGFKAFVFYGDAHLIRERISKNPGESQELFGYFIAHYLDSLYSRRQVITFQTNFSEQEHHIEEFEQRSFSPDFLIYTSPDPPHPLRISFIKSKTYFAAMFDLLQKFAHRNTKEDMLLTRNIAFLLANGLMRTYLTSEQNWIAKIDTFAFLIRNEKNYQTVINQLINMFQNLIENYDSIKAFENLHQTLTFNHFPDSAMYNQELRQMLSNLKDIRSKKILSLDDMQSLEKNKFSLTTTERELIIIHQDAIRNYLAIGALFSADEPEKKSIIEYLKHKTGLNFNTEKEWYAWWLPKIKSNLEH